MEAFTDIHDGFCFCYECVKKNRDMITRLPVEVSCMIFRKLNDGSLNKAFKTCQAWRDIIKGDPVLLKRINFYRRAMKEGRRNIRKIKELQILVDKFYRDTMAEITNVRRMMEMNDEYIFSRPYVNIRRYRGNDH